MLQKKKILHWPLGSPIPTSPSPFPSISFVLFFSLAPLILYFLTFNEQHQNSALNNALKVP